MENPPSISFPGIFWPGQALPRPALQKAHSPQGNTAGTNTLESTRDSNPSPAAATFPTASWPSTIGIPFLVGTDPFAYPKSVWQRPQAITSTITSAGPGSGISRDFRTKGLLASSKTYASAFILMISPYKYSGQWPVANKW